jgi:hypothetical protein
MLLEVNWHCSAIVGHQNKIMHLAPAQDLRVFRSALWGASVANTPHCNLPRRFMHHRTQMRADIFINQIM